MSDLDTPSNAEDVYFAVGEEISPHRPMFTGDVYKSDDGLWMVVQHPCAIRRGSTLNSKILVAPCLNRRLSSLGLAKVSIQNHAAACND